MCPHTTYGIVCIAKHLGPFIPHKHHVFGDQEGFIARQTTDIHNPVKCVVRVGIVFIRVPFARGWLI